MSDPYLEALTSLERRASASHDVRRVVTPQLTWLVFAARQRTADQGWKIHASSAANELESFLVAVTPLLLGCNVTFKLPASVFGVELLNAGEAGETQIGKVLTIYPSSSEEALIIAKELDSTWPSTRGPTIRTDILMRRGGAIGLRYGGFVGDRQIVDGAGLRHAALVRPDGVLVPDQRAPRKYKPSWVSRLPFRGYLDLSERDEITSFGRRRLLPLKILYRSGRGEVRLVMNLSNGSTHVVKTARRGVAGDRRGHDAQSRLWNEYQILRRLRAAGCTVGPRALGFERNETAALLLDDIAGTALDTLTFEEQLKAFPLLAKAVDRLHAHGIAHRDIKLSNAIATRRRVYLIDFELAALLGTSDVPLARTRNYRDHQDVVSPADDRLALAATYFAIITRCDPSILPEGRWRLERILSAIGRTHERNLYVNLISRRANQRLHDIIAAVRPTARQRTLPRARLRRWAFRTCLDAARATREFRRDGCWMNSHIQYEYPVEGINLGAAGIILGLLSIDNACRRQDFANDVISGADWLVGRWPSVVHAGVFMGLGGVALALTVVGGRFRRRLLVEAGLSAFDAAVQNVSGYDLFSGAAGLIWIASIMSAITGSDRPLQRSRGLAIRLLKSARRAGDVPVWHAARHLHAPAPLLGAAHGSAGIAMSLALWGSATDNKDTVTLAKEVFHALAGRMLPNGWPLHADDREIVHGNGDDWCNGAAGMLWCLLEAFGSDAAFQRERSLFIDFLLKKPPVSNPTLCHGLAGQLDLWRIIGGISPYGTVAASRAAQIACVLRAMQIRDRSGTIWSSESPAITTPDLWVGFLGPAVELAMLAREETSSLLSARWLMRLSEGS